MVAKLIQFLITFAEELSATTKKQEQRGVSSAKQHQTAKQREPSAPIHVTVHTELNLPQSVIDDYETDQHQSARRDRIRLGIESLVLLTIVAGGVTAYFQLRRLDDSIKQASTLNQLTADSVIAAKDAAEAAKRSADIAAESFRFSRDVSERPYLTAINFKVLDFETGKKPSFQVQIHNGGRTAAVNVFSNMTITMTAGPLPKAFTFEKSGTLGPETLAMSERITHNKAMSQALGPEIIPALDDELRRFFVIGWITYQDASGHPMPREDFCFTYIPPRKRASADLFANCEKQRKD